MCVCLNQLSVMSWSFVICNFKSMTSLKMLFLCGLKAVHEKVIQFVLYIDLISSNLSFIF